MRCAVFGCASDNQLKNVSSQTKFFRFPSNEASLLSWKTACYRKDFINVKFARVCDKHFKEDDYARNLKHELLGYTPKSFRSLKDHAIPTQNLPSCVTKTSKLRENKRAVKRADSELIATILETHEEDRTFGDGNNILCMQADSNVCFANVERKTKDKETNTEEDEIEKDNFRLRKRVEELEKKQELIKKIFRTTQIKTFGHAGAYSLQ